MKKLAAATVAALLLCGCHHIDNDRIPPMPVYIPFTTIGQWEMYGVAGATDHRRFIKETGVPSGYPYSAITETGYGGVLLVSDVMGELVAYDLSCPVEARQNVRISVDSETNQGRCSVCGSTYDIFTNYGTPLSGPAAEKGWGLTIYHVSAGNPASIPYRTITR